MFPFGAMLEIEITGGLLLPGHLNVIKHGLWPGVVRAGFELRGDGALRSFDINGTLVNYDAFWMDLNARTPAIGDLYEARVTDTMIGGSDPFFPGSSAVGSWIQMTGGGPIWFLENSSKFFVDRFEGLCEVREIAVPANIVSMTFVIQIDQEDGNQ